MAFATGDSVDVQCHNECALPNTSTHLPDANHKPFKIERLIMCAGSKSPLLSIDMEDLCRVLDNPIEINRQVVHCSGTPYREHEL